MKPVDLNDYLNENNPWSHRFSGTADFGKNRDIDRIEGEYNRYKFTKPDAFNYSHEKDYSFISADSSEFPES